MTDHTDIKDYHVIRWRSCISIAVEYFSNLLQDPKIKPIFDTTFADRLGERIRELHRIEFRALFLLLPCMLLIGAFDSKFIEKITIFGISLSEDNATIAILLLISAILMMFSSTVSTVSGYYSEILAACIEAHYEERVARFFRHQFQWDIGTILAGLRDNDFSSHYNLITIFVVCIWGLIIISAAIIVKVLMLLIFAGGIVSTWNISGIPDFVTVPIVVVATCAFVFDITSMLLRCPLPSVDYSNLKKLNELEKTDPIQAEKIRVNIAERGLARDRRNVLTLQIAVVIGFIVGATYADIGVDLFTKYEIIVQILIALIIVDLLSSSVINTIERKILAKIFGMTDKELSFEKYVSIKKRMWYARLLVAVIVGMFVFFWLR